MTTIAEYRQLTPSQVDRLMRNPEEIEAFLEAFDADEDYQSGFDDDDDDDFDDDEDGGRGARDDDEEESEEDDEEDEDFRLTDDDEPGAKYLSLENSWQSVHFLLTGTVPGMGSGELSEIFLGGTDVSDEEIALFDARVIAPDEVPALSAALSKIKTPDLKSKYNAKAFKDAKVEGFTDDFPGLVNYVRELTSFFEDASEKGNAVLITIR